MSLKCKVNYISEQQYLEDEKKREIKHEYIVGEVCAMDDFSRNHVQLTGNVARRFGNYLADDFRFEVFLSQMKLRVNGNFFYPDVLVVHSNDKAHDYYVEKPLIIVEVLSKTTRRFDKTGKFEFYKTIPSLEEYVLIEQNFAEIEICRRSNNWYPQRYFLGDEITFESITVSVEAIYKLVQNEDVLEFLAAKENTES